MGNNANDEDFYENYKHFCRELYRVMAPGRLVAVHCKELVYYRTQRKTAGLRDLPGELIRCHIEAGFDFHSRVTIWRCPVMEMTKTKAHGLLYKQLRADSSFSRVGLPEYFCVFRKWEKEGDEHEEVMHTTDDFPLSQWQEWASPVWMNTRVTDTLNAKLSKGTKDERHICPLALDLIERAIVLWSNPADVVLSPFMGIGSEGVVAAKLGRKFVGIELKDSYFKESFENLDAQDRQASLLAAAE